jgi:hypothetical protein
MPDIPAATQAQDRTDAEIAAALVALGERFNREVEEPVRNALQAQMKALAQSRADLRALELRRILDSEAIAEALRILARTDQELQKEVRRLKDAVKAVDRAVKIVGQVEKAVGQLVKLLP